MSVSTLRTFEDPFWTMTTSLDGRDYLFTFKYNQREDRWYFDVALTDGTELVNGVKVVCDLPLLRRFVDSRLPPGILLAMPNTKSRKAPGLKELGQDRRVTLVYVSASELAT